ncbi:MAG: hypothetical protein CMJ81_02750 [Planctomycetaceae bacterium]|nr:hypothetical protein [Planctomycetaceae bacterium]
MRKLTGNWERPLSAILSNSRNIEADFSGRSRQVFPCREAGVHRSRQEKGKEFSYFNPRQLLTLNSSNIHK